MQTYPVPGKNINDRRQNLNLTISGYITWIGIPHGLDAPNYEVGEDENLKYENTSPLLTSESHCQHHKRLLTTEKSVLNKGLVTEVQTTNIQSVRTRYNTSMKTERLNQKLARMTNQLIFLDRYQDLKLVPPGLTLKIPVNSRRVRKVTKRLEHELVRDRLHNNINSVPVVNLMQTYPVPGKNINDRTQNLNPITTG